MEKKRVKVLQVVTIMDRGGLETMLMNYYRKMDLERIQFDFLVHRDEPGHYDEEIKALGGRIFRMPPIRPRKYKEYFQRLDKFFQEHSDYDVVHAHINENSSFVLRAAQKVNIPCRIAHSHLSDLPIDRKLPFRLYARHMMKHYPTHYFACSKNAGKWLFGSKGEQATVLQNAVDVERFQFQQKTRSKLRKSLKLENNLVIGHIGRFNKQKNHSFLIDIFKEIHAKEPKAKLVLVGEGPLRGQMARKVRHLGLQSNVLFLGVRKDVPELMHAFDLFLFPSLFEGLPVVLVEAQAAGLKCVVSQSITKEVDLTNRVTFLHLKKDAKHWAEHILSLNFDHKDTNQLLKQNGYDTGTMANWLRDYYESLSGA